MQRRGVALQSPKHSQNEVTLKYLSYRDAAMTAGTAEYAGKNPDSSPQLLAKSGRGDNTDAKRTAVQFRLRCSAKQPTIRLWCPESVLWSEHGDSPPQHKRNLQPSIGATSSWPWHAYASCFAHCLHPRLGRHPHKRQKTARDFSADLHKLFVPLSTQNCRGSCSRVTSHAGKQLEWSAASTSTHSRI